MLRSLRVRGVLMCAPLLLLACSGPKRDAPVARVASDSGPSANADSIPDERPDSIAVTLPDSMTMLLALLPAPQASADDLRGDAASLSERAVFVPRTQRWFMARTVDGRALVDIGRIDGTIRPRDDSSPAFADMIAARSPVHTGMRLLVHHMQAPALRTVNGVALLGRRIVARLDAAGADSTEAAYPVEWRGESAAATASRDTPGCTLPVPTAVEAAIARYGAGAKETITVLRGCFQTFRAIVVVRPNEITPESTERVTYIRNNGSTRVGRLRDLSYPLHQLHAVVDVNSDGVHEIVVRSFRPAMETWAALRMTDSVTFTRFASGFTLEKR